MEDARLEQPNWFAAWMASRNVGAGGYSSRMQSVELFAGAGGLALGAELAGLKTRMLVEWDRWAANSLRLNQLRHSMFASAVVSEGDVRQVDWNDVGPIDVVTGGPPCQPFSLGGLARAFDDPRDMFPAAVEVVRRLRPRAFVFENVKGLTRASFANYFQYIQLQLELPEVVARSGETWDQHLRRLQSEHTTSASTLRYNVITHVANAADYGVPQQRHRVFFIGFRSDVQAEYEFPMPTHSQLRLHYDQWVAGTYWERVVCKRPKAPLAIEQRLSKVPEGSLELERQPWKTIAEAFDGLGAPSKTGKPRVLDHKFQPGARSYPGHTGSPIDAPSKALKAGAHGVPGGENMLRYRNGAVRYFSVREAARLQTFPDDYEFHGAWSEVMRQLGNAVPVELGRIVISSVVQHLMLAGLRSGQDSISGVSGADMVDRRPSSQFVT